MNLKERWLAALRSGDYKQTCDILNTIANEGLSREALIEMNDSDSPFKGNR